MCCPCAQSRLAFPCLPWSLALESRLLSNAAGAGPQLVLLGEEGSLARAIPRGRSIVRPCREREGPSCGLLTITGPATCTFTGLRWNLGELRLMHLRKQLEGT